MYSEDFTTLQTGRCYRHFKGMLYFVIGVGRYTEKDREPLVAYKSLYGDGELHFRPYHMFIEPVPENKQSENVTGQTYRFEPFDAKLVM